MKPLFADTRGVTPLIGFILLFALLVMLFALYQVEYVTHKNFQAEYEHNQQVQNELIDLRDTSHTTGMDGISRTTTITLGTRYESGVVRINPVPPAGTVSTDEFSENVSVEQDGNIWNFSTNALIYEPRYNEYSDAPTTRIEHTLLYNEFVQENTTVVRSGQRVIEPDRVVIPIVEGNLAESDIDRVSISVLHNEQHTLSLDEQENVTVTLPTDEKELWEKQLAGEPADRISVEESPDGSVRYTANVSEVTFYRIHVGDVNDSINRSSISDELSDI